MTTDQANLKITFKVVVFLVEYTNEKIVNDKLIMY